ncbi:DUF421 domain-containing protein [Kineococcus terrestris]|uniref:DUF421 domain-containing protein n=1 Tax=Kineococcus terrestris TaxID=2044856 RepID=UPI0034DB720C
MEIVVRAVVVFAFLWLLTRVVGRSTLGELTTFELLLFVTMGDLVQQAVTQQDYSLTAGLLAVSVFAVLTIVLSWTTWRFPSTRPVLQGTPLVLVRDGEPVLEALRSERLSLDELLAAARQQGVRGFAEIDLAVLEVNGRLSFFRRSGVPGGGAGATEQPPAGA